jgi:hypothetical protein
MFKQTLVPFEAQKRRLVVTKSDRPPSVVFHSGSILKSFPKDQSEIGRKEQANNSSAFDSSLMRGLNRSSDKHPNYRSAAFFGNERYPMSNEV